VGRDPSALELVITFAGLALVAWLFRRWQPGFNFGTVGLIFAVLPGAYAFFSHRVDWSHPAMVVGGIIILAADLTGKFRRKKAD
jgi:hypothetical protein